MEIGIQLKVKLDANTMYNMGLDIPTSISMEQPFNFAVIQETGTGEAVVRENVMQITFGDKDHIYAQIQPPKSIIELAGIEEYIDSFQASVTEGAYDKETGKFIETKNNLLEDTTES